MSEIKTVVDVVQVDRACEACGEGKMRPTGVGLMVYPPIYPHACDRCGAVESYREIYPKLEYVARS